MMIGKSLEDLLRSVDPANVAEYFLWTIVALFVLAAALSKLGKYNRLVANTPNLLTSIGILGTFTGIVIGLMGFDTDNIDQSINGLLAGLKTAFITSLAGMFGSIMFKMMSSTPLLQHQNTADADAGLTLLDAMRLQGKQLKALHSAIAGDEESSLAGQIKLFRHDTRDNHVAFTNELWGRLTNFAEMLSTTATEQVINALNEVIADFNNNLTEQFGENFKSLADAGLTLLDAMRLQGKQLKALHSAIAGDEESSLAGQIKLFRHDTRDNHVAFTNELWGRLTNFAEMLSTTATEQVINALNEVIADFNNNLTEQFGENFKSLDAAVRQLVEWQENYRLQLEQMSEQYRQGVEAITQTAASVASISEGIREIPQVMDALKAVMEVNQHQIKELGRHLEAFAEVRDQAVQAVPELQQQVTAVVTGITDATQQLVDGMRDSATSLSTNLTDTSATLATHTEQIREQLHTAAIDLSNNTRETMQILTDGAQSITQESVSMRDVLQATGTQVQQDVQAIQTEVAQSIEEMQRLLKDALEELVDGMRDSATSLSTNLTDTSATLATHTEQIREQLHTAAIDLSNNTRETMQILTDGAQSITQESVSMRDVLQATGTQVQQDVQAIQTEVAQSIEEMQRLLKDALEEISKTQANEITQVFDRIDRTITRVVEQTETSVNSQLTSMDQAMGKEVERAMQAMGAALAQQTETSVNSQLELMDRAMEQEVERVMQAMGVALASISNKFTDDYSKLVRAMQAIVQQGHNRQ